MNIIELIQQDNFKTSHVAATNGGEFHGENIKKLTHSLIFGEQLN